mgnify:CR=1 FL=1
MVSVSEVQMKAAAKAQVILPKADAAPRAEGDKPAFAKKPFKPKTPFKGGKPGAYVSKKPRAG